MYFIKGEDVLLITETMAVHFDPTASTQYAAEYLAWVAEGNTAEEWTGN